MSAHQEHGLSSFTSRQPFFLLALFFALSAPGPAFAQRQKTAALPNFDARFVAAGETSEARSLADRRSANINSFLESAGAAGMRIVPNRQGVPQLFMREGAALSPPSTLAPEVIARNFIRANSAVFPFSAEEIDGLRLTRKNVTSSATFLAFNQVVDGVDVFEGQMKVVLGKAGEVIMAGAGDMIPGLRRRSAASLTPEDAVLAAFRSSMRAAPTALSRLPDSNGRVLFNNPAGSGFAPVTTELSLFPLNAAGARLAYRMFVQLDPEGYYEILVDADTGALLFRQNLTARAQARVWTQSPAVGTRQLLTLPNAWLSGVGTTTTGNNTDAYLDADGDGQPDSGFKAGMSLGRAFNLSGLFDFTFADGLTGQDPRNYQPASITNLFYFVNSAHDYFYNLGFTETAGNFQTDNFGRGGFGNDAVLALAQCGSTTDNTWFQTPADGIPPRMCAGLYTRGTSGQNDDLDAAFDGTVVLHEYGHGVANRLVGGGSSTSCLGGIQSGALGEGWADYFAASYYNTPIVGSYVSQSPAGLRRQSYEGYTYTYEDIGNQRYSPHNDGEIWAATLWDLRKSLGQAVTDQLVINGMKATVCRPSMTDARDAILAADQASNGGANRAALWQVFARHGLGYTAAGVDGSFATGTRYDANFDLPPDLQPQKSPAVTSNPLATVAAMGNAYDYTVTASNPNSGTLHYALTSGPADMTVGSGSGAVTWTSTFTGQRIKITVTDGAGGKVVHGYYLPVVTPITQGVPILVSGSNGLPGFASFRLPSAAPALQVTLRGGSGDPDLFVSGPGESGFSYRDGSSNETLTFASPAAQTDWLIEVDQFQPYTGVALKADAIIPALIPGNSNITGLSDVKGGEQLYRIPVPAGATLLRVTISGGSGNADLLLRRGVPAVCQYNSGFLNYLSYPCPLDSSSKNPGNADSITINNPVAGDWYLDLFAADAYAGVTLATQVVTGPLADLTISKSHTAQDGSANFSRNQTGSYSLVVTNAGGAATFGQVSVTDALPAGLTATALSGTGWSCTLATLTCTRNDALASGASYPPIILTVSVPASGPGSVTNSATVSGGGDTNPGNNSAQDLTTILSATATVDSLLPNTAMAGTAGFVMTVRGSSFINGCVVQWNGSNRPTTYVSPTEVRAAITATDVATAGTAQVVVVNPSPGEPSAAMPFTIAQLSATQWTSIGSTAVNAPIGPVAGRVTGIAPHPTDADIIHIATSGGGVWKTLNAGGSWMPLTDTQKNLAMGSIAVAPSNPNVIYAGTGDFTNWWDTNTGSGILTSTDGGASWSLRTGPSGAFDRLSVPKIAVHPNDPATAYAIIRIGGNNSRSSNDVGVWKTTDTGATWVKTPASALGATVWTDVQIDPVTPNTVYASAVQFQSSLTGLYKSTNGGAAWFPLSFYSPASVVGSIAFALAPSNPQVVYMAATQAASPFGLLKFARSDNGGSTFTDLTDGTPDFTCAGGTISFGFSPIVLTVDRQNPMIVYAGGADCGNRVLRSVDGGVNWTSISSGAGMNHRAFAMDANGRLLDGTDFGIWRLTDPAAPVWANLNSNLNTLQTTSVGLHPTDMNRALSGTSNAGTNLFEGTTLWRFVDDINSLGIVKFSPTNPNRAYRSNRGVHRSDDGGNTWVDKVAVAGTEGFPLHMPFAVDRANANRVLVASGSGLLESVDGGDTWTTLASVAAGNWHSEYTYTLAVSQTDPNTIYVGLDSKVRVTTTHGSNFQTVNLPLSGPVQSIQVSPTSSQTLYVAIASFGGGVLKSTNGGQTWTNITGNLPAIPVWSLQLDPANADVLYAGAWDGVYRTTNGGSTWARFGTGLPNAQVWEIDLNSTLGVLAAATNGRGVWAIRTLTVAPASVGAVGGTPQSTQVGTAFGTALQARVLDASSNPVAGVTVTFTAPASGASATFSGNASTTAVTDAAGIATSPVPAANATVGGYTVTASAGGLTPAQFSLTNTAPPPPASIAAFNGTPQSTMAGTAFGAALQARVLDASSNPVAGVTVTFTAPASGASATFNGNASTTAVTNASGVATSPAPMANATVGGYTVTATVNALTPAQFALTNTAPPPASIAALSGTPQSTTAGTAFGAALQARVLDASSNPVAGVTVTFTAPASGASATFNGNASTTAVTNASGVATSPVPAANAAVGGYTVTASVNALTPAQFALTNTTLPPASVGAVGGTPQSTQVGTAFGTALQAQVLDASSNPVAGVTVTFTAPASGASATFSGNASTTAVTNASGIATSPVPAANATVGGYTVTASVNALTPAQFALTNTAPPPPASIAAFSGTPQSTTAGAAFGAALQARVLDASSNPVAGVTVTFTAPASGASATFNGNASATAVTNASGVATSPVPMANATVGGYTVTATVNALTPAQFALTNTAPPPASIAALSGTPQSTQVGTSFGAALQARVLDASSNPVAGVTVTFAAPASGASATLNGNASTTAVTNASGIATSPVPAANGTAGTYTVTASVSGLTPAQFSLTNTPLPPASIAAVVGTPQSTTVGTVFGAALQARVLNASSNPVAGVTVTFTAPASGASATFNGNASTTALTNASGIATSPVPAANGTVGSYVVTASVAGLAPAASFNLTNTVLVIGLVVAPKTATLSPSQQQAFIATVTGTANTAVTWSLSPNVGTMSGNTYTAPATIAATQNVILTATSQADNTVKDTAAITLMPPDATIFAANAAPASCSSIGSGTELGVKFRSDVAGQIRGVRFYKNATDNTAHTGTLWSTAGVVLATGTFTNETASGWQTLKFATPVTIAANTTYIASYHTNGWYCSTPFAFSSAGVDNPPLHALRDGVDGPNGVFANNANGGVMPTLSYVSSNFWVDVLFAATPPQVVGSIVTVSGTPQSTPAGTAFGAALQAQVLDASSNPIAGATVTFTAPASGASATFNGNASATAVTNASGIATSPVPLANTTPGTYAVTASISGFNAPFSLTNDALTPASIATAGGTPQTTVIATSFGAALQARVTNASALPVAGVTVTFTAPGSGAGATFNGNVTAAAVTNASGIATSPVPVANGTLGSYVVTASVAGLAPTASFNLTNVSVPVITVTVAPKTATLSTSGQQSFIATVTGTGNTAVTWSLSPNVGTMSGATYTAPPTIAATQTVILTAASQADNTVKDTAAITLKPPDATIFPANAGPATCNTIGSGNELGVKFRSDVAGQIRGIRFFKNAADNTAHTGTLWSTAGAALATGTFTNETGSGWQTLLFANPVTIAANTTYIASYHTNGWYCSTPFAFSSAGVDNPPLHALRDGVDGPNGVSVANVNGSVMPTLPYVASNFWVDVLFAATPPQVVGSIATVSGTPQSTPAGTAFGAALQAQVLDASSNPIAGATVTFTAPASGASATFNGNASTTAVTNASGIATSPVPLANTTPGTYAVTASISGFNASFSLTNTALTPAAIAAVGGTPQTTVISTSFGAALQARVTNASSLPVAGVTVTFTAPPSGASAAFSGNTSTAAVTNASGIATSPVPVANGTLGSYVVTASVAGLAPTASFNLGNVSVPLITVTVAPKTATLYPSEQQAFTATVTGSGNTAVTWSLSPNVGTMSGATYTAPSTIAATQTVILTATSQADNTVKDTAAITLKPPDATLFPANAAPSFCNGIGSGTELGVKFRSDVAGQIRGIRFFKNATDNTAHTGTLWSAAGVALATGTFTNETASGWQTLLFANPVTIAANTTYIASYHTNGWYCSTAFAFSSAGVDRPPLHALRDGVDGPNGVYVNNANGGVMPTLPYVSSNFWVDVLFAAAPAQVVGSIATVSGTPQSTPAGTAFGAALQARVLDTSSNPIAGATVTFTAPASGASAIFNGNATATAVTNASGIATSPVPLANTTPGTYAVTASISGFNASFSLTNAALTPAAIAAVGGTPQTAIIATSFGAALQARVTDASSIPVAGVTVTFTAPASGAGAAFNGNASAAAVTNASGIATSPVPSANGTLGSYVVTASVAGLGPTASFSLTNVSVPSITVAVAPKTVTLYASQQQAFTATVTGTGNTAVTWSLSPNAGAMSGATYTAPASIAATQTVILTAASQADNTVQDTATITLKPPDATIFPANAGPAFCSGIGSGTELGVKFRSDVAGQIRGIRFFKNSMDSTTHTGTLWSAAGVALATGTFTNETASGWQTLIFAAPVTIAANTTYVASYHTNGWYCSTAFAFLGAGVDSPPLHALRDGVDGPNGVYVSNANGGVMPALPYVSSNYWVDVLFTTP